VKKRDFIISYTWKLEWRDVYRKVANKFYDFWKLFLFNLLLLSYAEAQIAEVCGSGIGTTAKVASVCPAGYAEAFDNTTLCYRLCTNSADQDNDGFTTTDCDDTDRFIYPNIATSKGCLSTEFRTCQAGGTFSACSSAAFTCATGTGVNYYVNAGTGNDVNACTSASPCATLHKFGGGYSGAPGGAITLNAGDCVIVTGTTNITSQHAFTGNTALLANNRSGTLANPIRLTRDPRSSAKLYVTSNEFVYFNYPAQYWRVDNLILDGGNSAKGGIVMNSARDTEVNNNLITNLRGSGSNNDSGIYHTIDGSGAGVVNIHHNMIKDVRWDGTTSRLNVRDIMVLNRLTTVSGSSVSVTRNVSFEPTYSATLSGVAFGRKHGNDLGMSGGSTMIWSDNIAINKYVGQYNNGAYQRVDNNRFVDVGIGIQWVSQDTNTLIDNQITDNFVRGETFIDWGTRSGDNGDELLSNNNIFVSSKASYGGGEGVYTIFNGGSSADETTVKAQNMFISTNNCFYNSATTPLYGWFQYGAWGGLYNFANWKTDSAQDSTSFEENPVLDTFLVPTSVNCLTKGWQFLPSGGGGGGGGGSSSSSSGNIVMGGQPWLSY
jgi:hypothetical protein